MHCSALQWTWLNLVWVTLLRLSLFTLPRIRPTLRQWQWRKLRQWLPLWFRAAINDPKQKPIVTVPFLTSLIYEVRGRETGREGCMAVRDQFNSSSNKSFISHETITHHSGKLGKHLHLFSPSNSVLIFNTQQISFPIEFFVIRDPADLWLNTSDCIQYLMQILIRPLTLLTEPSQTIAQGSERFKLVE